MSEFGAKHMLTGEDGDRHKELRDIMRSGYSKESIKGRYDELVAITDGSLTRDWSVGKEVRVVEAMQYMVVDQLGTILTSTAPLEYVKDVRTAIIYILNVLVTRQRPKLLLKRPEYKKAKGRAMGLGYKMIKDAKARYATTRPEDRNLIDDIMAALKRRFHECRPDGEAYDATRALARHPRPCRPPSSVEVQAWVARGEGGHWPLRLGCAA